MAVCVFSTPFTFLWCLIPSHHCSSPQTSNELCQRDCSSQQWMLPLLNSSMLFQTETGNRPPSRREKASSSFPLRSGCSSALQNKSSDYKFWSWMGKAGSGIICLAKILLWSQASICFGMVPLNPLGSTMWSYCRGCLRAQTHGRHFDGDKPWGIAERISRPLDVFAYQEEDVAADYLHLLGEGTMVSLPAQVRTGQKLGFHASLLVVYQARSWMAQVAHLISESWVVVTPRTVPHLSEQGEHVWRGDWEAWPDDTSRWTELSCFISQCETCGFLCSPLWSVSALQPAKQSFHGLPGKDQHELCFPLLVLSPIKKKKTLVKLLSGLKRVGFSCPALRGFSKNWTK